MIDNEYLAEEELVERVAEKVLNQIKPDLLKIKEYVADLYESLANIQMQLATSKFLTTSDLRKVFKKVSESVKQ